MMDVGDLVELEGWLVIIDYKLFLIPDEFSEDYESGEKIEISRPEIIFSIIEKVLPLAGGKSFIFHKSKLSGVLTGDFPVKISPVSLLVEERGQGFVCIDLEGDNFETYKAQYEEFVKGKRGVGSSDWIDWL
ncbi:hypothetical protein A6723_022300 [Pseudomonas sp. AU11447]|nr:hypothetical protein A6723_022300 [Pseudomonas sp. AU11447]